MDLSNLKREDVKVVDDDLQTILADTIARYERNSGKTLQPAHIERLLINVYAYREALTRQQVNEAYRQQHVRFATGLMLDLCGDDVATPRLEAQPALTTLRFSCDANLSAEQVFIPVGTQVSVGELTFKTTTSATLSSSRNTVDLPAQCTITGTAGNGWTIGQINTLVKPLHDEIDVEVSNITVSSGGVVIESDDSYRERILLAFEAFSVGGPRKAYEYYARRVSQAIVGVHVGNDVDSAGNAIGGTVAVTLLTTDGLPGQELIDKVSAALSDETVRPLCDTVIVRAPEVVEYKIDARLVLFKGADSKSVLAAASAAWSDYETARYSKLGKDVVPLDIQTALKVSGVYNVILSNQYGELRDSDVILIAPNQWARCVSFGLSVDMEQQDG